MSTITDEQVEAEYLRECFDVSDDGALIWRSRPARHFKTEKSAKMWNGRYAGSLAGAANSLGYREVKIAGRSMKEHRVMWCIVNGAHPIHEIDHINGNRSDNRPSNLRDVPKSINLHNPHKMRKSKSGAIGVNVRPTGRFQAQIRVNGIGRYLGTYDTIEEASFAYRAAKKNLGLAPPENSHE